MGNELYLYIALGVIAAALLLLGIRFYLKNKKPKQKAIAKSGVNIDELLSALGGNGNIQAISSSMSKVTVELKDSKVIEAEKIKALGASGIVQNENKVSMIFGKTSQAIENEMKAKV
ncbi:hypothetical protein [Beduini massiliensis]|uniref:hypothetical protein n=1 Tax=Beduini massiliensis TaxID=1585974 RepID=UPI00059AA9CA|nr:hypothetical protein [Beduini massiliensis]